MMDNPLFPNQEHQKNHDAVMKSAQDFTSGVDDAVQQKFDEKRTVNDQYLGAGVGLYRAVQQFRTTDMGEEAQSRLAQAADAFGAIWAEQHGLQGVKISSAVTFDRNGEPHVRLYQGDDNFVTDFSYDNMEKYLRKNGYLDDVDKQLKSELGMFDQEPEASGVPAATTKDGKPVPYSDPLGDLFTYAQKMPPGLRTRIVMRGLDQLGIDKEEKEFIVSEMAKDGFWESVKAQGGSSSGGGGGGGANSGAAGFSDGAAPVVTKDAKKEGKALPVDNSKNGEGDSAISDFAAEVEAATTLEDKTVDSPVQEIKEVEQAEESPEKNDETSTDGKSAKAASDIRQEPAEPEPYLVGKANLRDDKQLARVEQNLRKQGFVVRQINGEYYMWHPQAKVWMASDGHTVVERNGSFVDSGVAPGKLQYETNGAQIWKAKGPGGQGDAEVTQLKRQVREDIPENFLKYLAFKNGANEEFLNEKSGMKRTSYSGKRGVPEVATRKDKYGNVVEVGIRQNGGTGMFFEQDEETTNREEGRIHAFEQGANGAKGVDTLARRVNNLINEEERMDSGNRPSAPNWIQRHITGLSDEQKKWLSAVDEVDAKLDHEIMDAYSNLSEEERERFLSKLDTYGMLRFSYAAGRLPAKDLRERLDAYKQFGDFSNEFQKKNIKTTAQRDAADAIVEQAGDFYLEFAKLTKEFSETKDVAAYNRKLRDLLKKTPKPDLSPWDAEQEKKDLEKDALAEKKSERKRQKQEHKFDSFRDRLAKLTPAQREQYEDWVESGHQHATHEEARRFLDSITR